MSWIKIISYDEAKGKLKRMYDRIKGPDNNVDNVMLIHSLRPHTLEGHMRIYKNVLHNSGNQLPKWYLEALGVYVSHLNQCGYCFDHHFAGFKRLFQDDEKAEKFKEVARVDKIAMVFDDKFLQGFQYAKKLTLQIQAMQELDVITLRAKGFTDGEILEINQVVSYFNYANRTVLGLGVTTDGDIIGLSPNNSDDPDNWNHT